MALTYSLIARWVLLTGALLMGDASVRSLNVDKIRWSVSEWTTIRLLLAHSLATSVHSNNPLDVKMEDVFPNTIIVSTLLEED